jgi:Protein of unknown function (DUF2934)
MARKRNAGSDSVVSVGAAPVREKRRHSAKRSTEQSTSGSSTSTDQLLGVADGQVASDVQQTDPDREAIARIAYSYWEARGYQGGSPEEDWCRAEQEYYQRQGHAANA